MLCSSQRNTDTSLQTILDASQKTDAKRELTDAVSQAFAEEDGISVDAIEQAINAKIEEIVQFKKVLVASAIKLRILKQYA